MRALLAELPSLRPRIGHVELRKVDKLSTIRLASARYSVPHQLVGQQVEAVTYDSQVAVYDADGVLVARHDQVGPGEVSILDEHYPTARRLPSRAPRARTDTERVFLALGEAAAAFIQHGAAGGHTMLAKDIAEIVNDLIPAHGADAVARALARAVRFSLDPPIGFGPVGEGASDGLCKRRDLRVRGLGLWAGKDHIMGASSVQLCVVHLVRNALRYASKKHWGAISADLRGVYTAPSVEAAETRFEEFRQRWGDTYPAMIAVWDRAWPEFIPFLAFPVELRRIVYTTNAIESLNARFRKAVRRRGQFPTEQAALKVLYLTAIERRPNRLNPTGRINGWKHILNTLTIHYEDRLDINNH